MTNLKTTLSNIKSQLKEHSSFYYYFESDKEKYITCSDFFVNVDIVSVSFGKLRASYPGSWPKYAGLYTQHLSCVPIIISACIMMDQPFICLDNEVEIDLNIALMEKLDVGVILTTPEEFKQLNNTMGLSSPFDEFELLDIKVQLWIYCGNNKHDKRHNKRMMYAIQTSGSTGEPKTVEVPEESILPNVSHLKSEWNVTADDVILLVSPPTFDPFMVELLLALSCGAALLVVPSEVRASPLRLLDTLFPADRPSLITIAQFTPSVFARWTPTEIRTRVLTSDTSLRVLALGGESFPSADWWSACRDPSNQTQLYNLYGITEVSCWAMMSPGLDLTLGIAMWQTLLRVEDNNGIQVEDGTGQLFVGSESRVCLIDGDSLSQSQQPVFRATGDIVSVRDGVYRYVGRKDNVMKRWGHKVSLEQVEKVAEGCADVAAACCVMHTDCLALFVKLREGSPDLHTVRVRLKQMLLRKLNNASQPDLILQHDHFPLTRNGKLYRNKLKKLISDIKAEEVSSTNPVDLFATLWKQYTFDEAESSTGFVDAGGNSVSAMQIVNHLTAQGLQNTSAMAVMAEMLNNKSFLECSQALSANITKETNRVVDLQKGTNCTEVATKKFEKDFEDELIHVQIKGHSSYFSEGLRSDLQLQPCWQYNLGKCIDATATIAVYKSGKSQLMVGSHSGRLVALELSSGSVLWETQLPDRIESSVTPSRDGSHGLIGNYDGSVYCIRLTDGSVAWSFKTQAMVKGTALLLEGYWFIGSYDYFVYCLRVSDGQLVWRYRSSGPVLATPLGFPQQRLMLVASLSGQLVALHSASGSVAWHTSLPSPVFSTPCVLEGLGLLVVAEVAGYLHALQPSTGTEIWKFQAAGKIFSSLVASEDMVLFGCHDSCVYSVHCSHGAAQLLWTVDMGSPVYATPCYLSPDLLIAAATSGRIHLINTITGQTVCTTHLPGEVFSSPIALKHVVVVGCRDNNVYCLATKHE